MGMKGGKFYEVEVKVDLADLRADKKKKRGPVRKLDFYAGVQTQDDFPATKWAWKPHHFAYLVPNELYDAARAEIAGTPFGLFAISEHGMEKVLTRKTSRFSIDKQPLTRLEKFDAGQSRKGWGESLERHESMFAPAIRQFEIMDGRMLDRMMKKAICDLGNHAKGFTQGEVPASANFTPQLALLPLDE
jgi:hypothetical protein